MKFLKITAAFIAAVSILAGCIKDKKLNLVNQPDSTPNTVDFNNQSQTAALDISPTPSIFTFYAEQNSSDKSMPGGTITIAPTPGLVLAAGLSVLPDSTFQLISNSATIDGTTQQASFQLKVFTQKLDLDSNYAVAYTITTVTNGNTIAANKKTIVISVGAKNKYDGVYELIGHHNRDPYTFQYDVDESMLTVDAKSVAFYWDDAASVGHPIGISPGVASWYGATIAPIVVFDPNTNLVTSVYNSPAAVAGGGPPITMFTGAGSGVSRYEPATKKMYVYWNYSGNPLRAFFDTLTFEHPR